MIHMSPEQRLRNYRAATSTYNTILLIISLPIYGSLQFAASQQQTSLGSTFNVSNSGQVVGFSPNDIKPLIQVALAAAPATSTIAESTNTGATSSHYRSTAVGQESQAIQVQQRAPSFVEQQQPSTALSYGNEDPIIYLDYSSINDEVLRGRTANLVYFNANFNHCRNCHKFFNIWKDLAVDIRWWKQVIKLFVINCSDEDNIEVCRRAGVSQFPQAKYYWIMSQSLDQDGQRLRILGKSVHAMRHLIMDKVLESYGEHNKLLDQRQQQLPSRALAGLTTSSISSSAVSNPIAHIMSNPMIEHLIGGSTSAGASANNPLSSIVGALSGKAGSTSTAPTTGISGIMSSLGGVNGISQMMNIMLGAGSMRKRLSIQPLPSNWPEFEQIEATDTQQLINMLPLDASRGIGALLIMETQEFLYTGLEVMLDLNPYANQTYIARVKDERGLLSKNLTKRDDIQGPALIYVTAFREPKLIFTAPKYTNDEDLRRAFVRTFERRQVKHPVKRIWSMQSNMAANQQANSKSGEIQEDEDILNKINQVYMNDLTNALRASLMDQVFRHSDSLSDDQYNALVKYVYALINYFPFNNDESLKFFKRLHSWLQNQVSPIDISEYKKQFHDIEEVLQHREWVACRSLSNTKAIPTGSKSKTFSLFENPAQLGKVVSNITRLLRDQQQQANKLKNFFSVFTSPVIPKNQSLTQKNRQQNQQANQPLGDTSTPSTSAPTAVDLPIPSPQSSSSSPSNGSKRDDSPIERIIKSLTSGSLGSDSSILKLISAALTDGSNGADSSSTKKSKFAREYPCGAWKLAHVMVVNEYIKDSPRKDVKHIVLHSLYQYMVHFYACPTCGNRVSDVSSEFKLNLDNHLLDQADSVLLLWKMHNRVNKRLESELRPGSPQRVQFPSESLCPKCRSPRTQNDLVSTPNWHEKQVLNFLVHHYRPQSLIINPNSSSSTTKWSSSSSSASSTIFESSLSLLGGHVKTTNNRVHLLTSLLSNSILLIACVFSSWLSVICQSHQIKTTAAAENDGGNNSNKRH